MVVGVGFEPTYAMRADLQSAAFNHSAIPPTKKNSLDRTQKTEVKGFWQESQS